MTEVDFARGVVGWLREHKWTVYQEVALHGGVADIVATQGRLVWIIECKTALNLGVIEQADRWMGCAHYRSAAVPPARRRHTELVCRIFEWRGIGLMHASHGSATEVVAPRLDRQARFVQRTRDMLRPEQQTFAEAGSSGGYWSPFKETCRNILEAVREEPGVEMPRLLALVKHHYRSNGTARACIPKWIVAGAVPGVELRREGSRLRAYPTDPAAPSAASR
jgi:hypothetical protein